MKNQRHYTRHQVILIPALVGLMIGATFVPGSARLSSAQAVRRSSSYTGNLNAALTPCPTGNLYGGSPGGPLIIINQTDGSGRVVGTTGVCQQLTSDRDIVERT